MCPELKKSNLDSPKVAFVPWYRLLPSMNIIILFILPPKEKPRDAEHLLGAN